MMEEKKICPLVQDLLPSLADGITQPESERFMREHMKTCQVCREMYAKMQTPEEEAAVRDEIPVEKFIRKQRHLKCTVIVLAVVLFLILLGITLFVASLIPPQPTIEALAVSGKGYILGDSSGVVDVSITGEIRIYDKWETEKTPLSEGDTGIVHWETFLVTDAAGNPLFDSTPYQDSLPALIPLQENNGIKSLLGVYNERDMTDYTHLGNLYARNRLTDFLLYDLTADGGYVLCYPCETKEEAEMLLYEYMQEFDLGGALESHMRRLLSE